MNSHDYFMRQIEDMAQFLAKSFFHKQNIEMPLFDEEGNALLSGIMYGRLKSLAAQGEINEAENILFSEIAQSPSADNFILAIEFYKYINTFTDEALLSCNYTKLEISEALYEIKELYKADKD